MPVSNHSAGSSIAFSLVSGTDPESGHNLMQASEGRRPGEQEVSGLVYSAKDVKAAISFPGNLI